MNQVRGLLLIHMTLHFLYCISTSKKAKTKKLPFKKKALKKKKKKKDMHGLGGIINILTLLLPCTFPQWKL